ncbi:MAG: MOSC domain-containing protein [Pirellulaceae bacterium]
MKLLLESIQIGKPQTIALGNFGGSSKSWTTGFLKQSVNKPIWLGRVNLAGDGQADLEHHGGPHKAVCVYPKDHFPAWRSDLDLPELDNGAFGENFTVSGLAEADVCVGDTWKIGTVTLQVSQPRQPCWKLARRWNIKDLADRVQQTGKTGWYFRVLVEGQISAHLPMELVERPHLQWTIAAVNQVMHHDKNNLDAATELASLDELSPSWKRTLLNRAQQRLHPNEKKRLDGES